MGGDRGELGGRSPKKLRWGDGPCIRPPIFAEVVLLGLRKYEQKKRKFFCEIDVFVKKRVIYLCKVICYIVIRDHVRQGIKKVIRHVWRENGIFFLRKGHSKIWSAKIFFRPPKLGARSLPMLTRRFSCFLPMTTMYLCILCIVLYTPLEATMVMKS